MKFQQFHLIHKTLMAETFWHENSVFVSKKKEQSAREQI